MIYLLRHIHTGKIDKVFVVLMCAVGAVLAVTLWLSFQVTMKFTEATEQRQTAIDRREGQISNLNNRLDRIETLLSGKRHDDKQADPDSLGQVGEPFHDSHDDYPTP